MKIGDRGWVMGYNSATPGTITGVVHNSHADYRHYGSTVLRVTLDSGEVMLIYPGSFLTHPQEVEQTFQERIDYWQQALNEFKKTL